MNCIKITVRLSLTFVLLALFSFTAVQAQEEVMLKADTTKFKIMEPEFEMAAGKPYVTDKLAGRIDQIFTGIKNPESKRYLIVAKTDDLPWEVIKEFSRYGILDMYDFKEASFQQKNDLLENDLELRRGMTVLSYIRKKYNIPPERIDIRINGAVEAERSVDIVVIKDNYMKLPLAQIDSKLDDMLKNQEEKEQRDNEQDKQLTDHERRIYDNESGIDDLERRVSDLEKDRSIGFSGHIGLGGQYFASELVPTAEIGLSVGQFEFTGFIGHMPDVGTADLDEGPTNYTRSQVGWSATWYALSNDHVRVGPILGFEWARDNIDADNCEIVYHSPLAGIAIDISITSSLSLYGNAAYAPVSTDVTGKLQTDVLTTQFRAGLRLNF